MSASLPPQDPNATDAPSAPAAVRHRTERDAAGRVWRFVYDPAAQEPMGAAGEMVRVRCTTGNARATIVVRADWLEWPRQQLLDELASALRLQRGGVAGTPVAAPSAPGADRRVARRRLVRDARGVSWNCVYDPSAPGQADESDQQVRVRCTAGRDRIELVLDPSWHRLGDRQLAELIERAVEARRR